MAHRIVELESGSFSVRNERLGETMHSHIGPEIEAREIYIEQSELATRLQAPPLDSPLVIYDLGLGIAANALLALSCRRKLLETGVSSRAIHLVSFENELDGLRLAMDQAKQFGWMVGFDSELRTILAGDSCDQEGEKWELIEGDFHRAALSGLPTPELIYFDFYSPRVNTHLWSVDVFSRLYKVSRNPQATNLFTYSAATAVRSAMLLAGFHVGYGRSTQAKLETTIASTKLEALRYPLDLRWFEKLSRSDKPFSEEDLLKYNKAELLEKIRAAPQFNV